VVLKVRFSQYAKIRLAERKITKKQVIEALTPLTEVKPGKGERFIAVKNGIRVVYLVKNGQIIVVTVTRA
jgi:hypothetical protein